MLEMTQLRRQVVQVEYELRLQQRLQQNRLLAQRNARRDYLEFWTQYLCRAPAIEWPWRALWHEGTEEATIDGLLVTQNLADQ